MDIISIEKNGLVYENYEYEELVKLLGITEVEQAITAQKETEILTLRRRAYVKESDLLYMEWQFDQTAESEQVWRDKVAQIKARYPLSSHS